MISFGYFLIFSATFSCQNIASKILFDLGFQNLGYLSVAVVYLTFSLGSLGTTRIIKWLGVRKTLCFGGLAYSFWAASFLVPSLKRERELNGATVMLSDSLIFGLLLFSAFIMGLGAGPLWVGQQFYVASCANDLNKGRFNSIFFVGQQSANIFCFPLAGYLISNFSKISLYMVVSLLSVSGSLFLLLLKQPIE